jgi:hypothetical protein
MVLIFESHLTKGDLSLRLVELPPVLTRGYTSHKIASPDSAPLPLCYIQSTSTILMEESVH